MTTTRWANKTLLAKLTTVFAISLTISVGLSGANFASVLAFAPDFISEGTEPRSLASRILSVTAVLELWGIGLSLLALTVTGVAAAVHAIMARTQFRK
jgi:hypothetical protein